MALALEKLKEAKKKSALGLLLKFFSNVEDAGRFDRELDRMGLLKPIGFKQNLYRKLLLYFLSQSD